MKKKVEEELNKETNPYQLDKLSKVPSWLIVLVLKYWAAAAAIYFIGMSVDIIDLVPFKQMIQLLLWLRVWIWYYYLV